MRSSPGHIAILVFLAMATANPARAADPQAGSRKDLIIYENAERTSAFEHSRDRLMAGPITPLKPTESQRRQFTEYLGFGITDCSDPQYRCIAIHGLPSAVPRKGLESGMRYTVLGNIFTVEHCLRESEGRCQVAIVQIDCQVYELTEEDQTNCSPHPGGRSASPKRGPVRYFIYNEDYGVTSFGTLEDKIPPKSEMKAVAQQYILQGDTGLLKE